MISGTDPASSSPPVYKVPFPGYRNDIALDLVRSLGHCALSARHRMNASGLLKYQALGSIGGPFKLPEPIPFANSVP